jgi:hypothetical protein
MEEVLALVEPQVQAPPPGDQLNLQAVESALPLSR